MKLPSCLSCVLPEQNTDEDIHPTGQHQKQPLLDVPTIPPSTPDHAVHNPSPSDRIVRNGYTPLLRNATRHSKVDTANTVYQPLLACQPRQKFVMHRSITAPAAVEAEVDSSAGMTPIAAKPQPAADMPALTAGVPALAAANGDGDGAAAVAAVGKGPERQESTAAGGLIHILSDIATRRGQQLLRQRDQAEGAASLQAGNVSNSSPSSCTFTSSSNITAYYSVAAAHDHATGPSMAAVGSNMDPVRSGAAAQQTTNSIQPPEAARDQQVTGKQTVQMGSAVVAAAAAAAGLAEAACKPLGWAVPHSGSNSAYGPAASGMPVIQDGTASGWDAYPSIQFAAEPFEPFTVMAAESSQPARAGIAARQNRDIKGANSSEAAATAADTRHTFPSRDISEPAVPEPTASRAGAAAAAVAAVLQAPAVAGQEGGSSELHRTAAAGAEQPIPGTVAPDSFAHNRMAVKQQNMAVARPAAADAGQSAANGADEKQLPATSATQSATQSTFVQQQGDALAGSAAVEGGLVAAATSLSKGVQSGLILQAKSQHLQQQQYRQQEHLQEHQQQLSLSQRARQVAKQASANIQYWGASSVYWAASIGLTMLDRGPELVHGLDMHQILLALEAITARRPAQTAAYQSLVNEASSSSGSRSTESWADCDSAFSRDAQLMEVLAEHSGHTGTASEHRASKATMSSTEGISNDRGARKLSSNGNAKSIGSSCNAAATDTISDAQVDNASGMSATTTFGDHAVALVRAANKFKLTLAPPPAAAAALAAPAAAQPSTQQQMTMPGLLLAPSGALPKVFDICTAVTAPQLDVHCGLAAGPAVRQAGQSRMCNDASQSFMPTAEMPAAKAEVTSMNMLRSISSSMDARRSLSSSVGNSAASAAVQRLVPTYSQRFDIAANGTAHIHSMVNGTNTSKINGAALTAGTKPWSYGSNATPAAAAAAAAAVAVMPATSHPAPEGTHNTIKGNPRVIPASSVSSSSGPASHIIGSTRSNSAAVKYIQHARLSPQQAQHLVHLSGAEAVTGIRLQCKHTQRLDRPSSALSTASSVSRSSIGSRTSLDSVGKRAYVGWHQLQRQNSGSVSSPRSSFGEATFTGRSRVVGTMAALDYE